jgi:hypothetical protein
MSDRGEEFARALDTYADLLERRANRFVDRGKHAPASPPHVLWDRVDAMRAGAAALRGLSR